MYISFHLQSDGEVRHEPVEIKNTLADDSTVDPGIIFFHLNKKCD